MRVLISLTIVAIGLSFWVGGVTDPDLGWHLLGGQWIDAYKTVPQKDFINGFNDHWHDYHWLGQILLYKIYSISGFAGLQTCFGLLMAALLFQVLKASSPRVGAQPPMILTLAIVIISAYVLAPICSVRPQLIAIVILAWVLNLLRNRPQKYELLVLYALGVFLVNVHVYWIFIPIFYFFYRSLPQILREPKKLWRHMTGTVALLLCGIVSPYGWENYVLLFEYATMPADLANSIVELRSIFLVGGRHALVLVFFAMLLTREFGYKRALASPGPFCTAILGACLAVQSVKFLGIFGITAIPYSGYLLRQIFRRHGLGRLQSERRIVAGLLAFLLLLSTYRASAGFPFIKVNDPELQLKKEFPIEACVVLAASLPANQSNGKPSLVATHFNFGGWCRWAIYQAAPDSDIRVSTDGRTQNSDYQLVQKSNELYELRPGWQGTLHAWNPDALVARNNQPIGQALRLLNDWKILFEDKEFTVFVPISAKSPV